MNEQIDDDLPENKQVAIWFVGLMTSAFTLSLVGEWGFVACIAVTLTTSITLSVYKTKQKKPAVGATTTSDKSKNIITHSCSQYNRK